MIATVHLRCCCICCYYYGCCFVVICRKEDVLSLCELSPKSRMLLKGRSSDSVVRDERIRGRIKLVKEQIKLAKERHLEARRQNDDYNLMMECESMCTGELEHASMMSCG